MTRNERDEYLVNTFLELAKDYSAREIGEMERFEGISSNDVSRWRRDEWDYLTGKKKRDLARTIARLKGAKPEPEDD